jgi:hypothetical protein
MDPAKVAQMIEVLNGLTARDALFLLVGACWLFWMRRRAMSERQQSLDNCIDLPKSVPVGLKD